MWAHQRLLPSRRSGASETLLRGPPQSGFLASDHLRPQPSHSLPTNCSNGASHIAAHYAVTHTRCST